jgi:ABC-type nitrate/sulfonate/bicarbonate transport system permease component
LNDSVAGSGELRRALLGVLLGVALGALIGLLSKRSTEAPKAA